MKVPSALIFAFFGLFVTAFSLPSPAGGNPHDVSSLVSSLFATVQEQTGAINATTAALSTTATDAEKAAAAASIQSAISEIVDAVTSTTKRVQHIHVQRSVDVHSVQARQLNVQALVGAVTTLLLDVSGALNNVIAALGLTQALAFAQPLVVALSNLLLALVPVVNNLLELVRQLLDSLLIGLSAALAGLVL